MFVLPNLEGHWGLGAVHRGVRDSGFGAKGVQAWKPSGFETSACCVRFLRLLVNHVRQCEVLA